MNSMVRVNDLVKRYGRVEAVRGVSFEAGRGEVFGLLGPNGAGKTSTLECIIGLRPMNGGQVTIAGLDQRADQTEIRQRIGVQLQATALQEAITIREAMTLFSAFYRKKTDHQALMERFGLADRANARFETLSGGQRQRLAIALALLHEPDVVFLDEPTANLDPQSRREVHRIIRELKAEGRTVVLSTHYIDEAEQLCDRVAIVDEGKVIARGRPEELIAASSGGTRIILRTAKPMDLQRVRRLEEIGDASVVDGALWIESKGVGKTIIDLVKLIEAEENELLDLTVRKASLEDVFIEMTGRRMRD